MKELCVENRTDLPRDFLQKFWIEPGDDFIAFLMRLRDKNLSFSLEAPDNASDVPDLISEQVGQIKRRGGPSVPESSHVGEGQVKLLWEFLSCKSMKVKAKDLRQPALQRAPGRREVIVVAASSKMLAPVEHKVKVIAKEFGFKNPLREHEDEAESL